MCANTNEYNGLYDEIRNSRGRYILDEIKMPDTCGNHMCTVEFEYYSDDMISIVCSEAPLEYSGSDPLIAEWVRTGRLDFTSFKRLGEFLARFNDDAVSAARQSNRNQEMRMMNRSSGVSERNPVNYDRDSITLPDINSSSIVVDKERLCIDIKSELFGQDEQVSKIVHVVRNYLGTKNKKRPLSVFLYGPPGTGKSAVAELVVKKINDQLNSRDKLYYKQVDCTQIQERFDVTRLIGAAPGYVGFDEPGAFSVVEEHPNTVFVFEEIEKAAPNAIEVIMQAMETGKQETNGKTLRNGEMYFDLSHCIMFFTSNIDLEDEDTFISRAVTPFSSYTSSEVSRKISEETREAKEKLLETGKFRKEIISRLSAIIKFNSLEGEALKDIAVKSIRDAADMHNLAVSRIDTPLLQEFINETVEQSGRFGAREFRQEAVNFFGDALLEYALDNDDGTEIVLLGTLDDIKISKTSEDVNEEYSA